MKRVPLLFITQSRRNPVSLPGFAIRLAKSEHNPHVQIDPVVLKLLNAKGSQFCSGTNVVHRRHTRAVGSFTCSNSGRFTDDEFTTNWARDFHGNIEKSAVRFFSAIRARLGHSARPPAKRIMDSHAGSAYAALTTIPTTTSLARSAAMASGYASGSIGSRINAYLNMVAFKPRRIGDDGAAAGFGTPGRNTYRGPFEQNWDFHHQEFFAHRAPEDSLVPTFLTCGITLVSVLPRLPACGTGCVWAT
jgi:hypothetical protein